MPDHLSSMTPPLAEFLDVARAAGFVVHLAPMSDLVNVVDSDGKTFVADLRIDDERGTVTGTGRRGGIYLPPETFLLIHLSSPVENRPSLRGLRIADASKRRNEVFAARTNYIDYLRSYARLVDRGTPVEWIEAFLLDGTVAEPAPTNEER